jgi:hypothetical protein
MENTLNKLIIQHQDGSTIDGYFDYFRDEENPCCWTLIFRTALTGALRFTSSDLFECLVNLRQELNKINYRPLCNGARFDVYPSGMCRDMGGGLSAYELKLNSKARNDDLVYIFDYASPELIASVEEQRDYYHACLNSRVEPQGLKIEHKNGLVVQGEIFQYWCPGRCKFVSSVTTEIEFETGNLFDFLIYLRQKLEGFGYRPLCNAARMDAYNTNDFFVHNKCSLFKMNAIPCQDDILPALGYSESSLLASVEEQKKYFESWLDSIKSIPISEYGEYGITLFPTIYFRLIKVGELPLMWLFDIEPSSIHYSDQVENSDDLERLRALSPLSPQEVEQIGSLNGEAILGFISGEMLNLEYFRPNKVFKDFVQSVIAREAAKDDEIIAAASEQQEGWLYIIDNRVADLDQEEISPGDILGAFEITGGLIVVNSYKPNENYVLFGNNGLMQLPTSLHEALIKALKEVEGD